MSANTPRWLPQFLSRTSVARTANAALALTHSFRRTITCACLAVALLIVVINSAGAQTTAPDFKTIDAVIDAYLPKLQAYEIDYLDTKGRGYMQALWSHSTPPADGALVAPDLPTSKPTDQAESFADLWSAVVIGQGKLPVRLRIDVYDGPSGRGYVITVEVIMAGRTYTRSINVGSERWRDVGWTELKAEQLP